MKIKILLIVVGMAAAVVAWGGISLYGAAKYRAGQASCQEAQRVADLERFRDEALKLIGLADDLQGKVQELASVKPKIIERYTHEVVQNPLPVDCVLDAGRVQRINDGINQANHAGIDGRTLPAGSGSPD